MANTANKPIALKAQGELKRKLISAGVIFLFLELTLVPAAAIAVCGLAAVGPSETMPLLSFTNIFSWWPTALAFEAGAKALALASLFVLMVVAIVLLFSLTSYSRNGGIYGPDAANSSDKGSSGTYSDPRLLADICPTWDGSWEEGHRPPYGTIPIGFIPDPFEEGKGRYLLGPNRCHSLTVGRTSAGKTTVVNFGAVDIFAAAGESCVLLDPKGEIFGKCAPMLEAHGVPVDVIDLRDGKRSNNFNPLLAIWEIYSAFLSEREKHLDIALEIARSANVVPSEATYEASWGGNTEGYKSFMSHMAEAEQAKNDGWSKGEQLCRQLAATLIEDRPDAGAAAHYDDVARQSLEGIMDFVSMYTAEDYTGEGEPYTEPLPEQRTLASVQNMFLEYGSFHDLVDIIDKIDHEHPAYVNTSNLRASGQKSYEVTVSDVNKFLTAVLNLSNKAWMNSSDFSIGDLGREQRFLFLIVPEESAAMGKMFIMLFELICQTLIQQASAGNGHLDVPVNFLLEEMPAVCKGNKIPDLENKLAYLRGYNMKVHITCQNLMQLTDCYGEEARETILDNCSTKVLLKTEAMDTAEYFSKMCGTYTYTEQTSATQKNFMAIMPRGSTKTTKMAERPVFTTDEIWRWNQGWGSIVLIGNPPKKPSAKAKRYGWDGSMKPLVTPSSPAWLTPTRKNLGIGTEEELDARMAEMAQLSRAATRTPTVPWQPKALTVAEVADRARVLGGIGAGAGTASRLGRKAKLIDSKQDARRIERLNIDPAAVKKSGVVYVDKRIDDMATSLRLALVMAFCEAWGIQGAEMAKKHPAYQPAKAEWDQTVATMRSIWVSDLYELVSTGAVAWDGLEPERSETVTLMGTGRQAATIPSDIVGLAVQEQSAQEDEAAEESEKPAAIEASEALEKVLEEEPPTPKAKPQGGKRPKKAPTLDEARRVLKESLEDAGTYDEYVANLAAHGWKIVDSGGELVYESGKARMRASTLGFRYSKEKLEKRFSAQ